MKISTSIEGLDILRRRMGELTRRVQGQALAKAARAGAEPILERARELAPRESGALATRGVVARDMVRKYTYAERGIGHHPDYFYGTFQELGVEPHTRRAGKRVWGVNVTGRRGGDARSWYTHPGHKAQPHLRPAADEAADAAVRAVHKVLYEAVMEAVRK